MLELRRKVDEGGGRWRQGSGGWKKVEDGGGRMRSSCLSLQQAVPARGWSLEFRVQGLGFRTLNTKP